jgi:ATP-dependent Clp protease ATP-binding subunit ClpB
MPKSPIFRINHYVGAVLAQGGNIWLDDSMIVFSPTSAIDRAMGAKDVHIPFQNIQHMEFKGELLRFRLWAGIAAIVNLAVLGFLSRMVDMAQQPLFVYQVFWLGIARPVWPAAPQAEQYQAIQAERNLDLQRVAEINYGQIPQLQKQIVSAQQKLAEVQKDTQILKEEVTEEDIAHVVSRWTGIPVTKMLSSETQKLAQLENELGKRVVNQKAAVKAVANAVRRSRAGIQEEGKPIGSFIFLGPTGVGKTELAKALAEVLFEDEKRLTRIDMSEYMEKHSVARLIGSPPGYVGYEEGGQLTEAVRRHPYSVILFDEIEKAHPEVFNVLLQVLDDGRLTDSKGKTVDFKNTVIIMTSNLGSDAIAKFAEDPDKQELAVNELLKKAFRPEFLNRIDDVIIFQPLTEEDISEIVKRQIALVTQRLNQKNIHLELSKNAIEHLAQHGYDPVFGARPLKRLIQHEILDELSLQLIESKIKEGDQVFIDYQRGKIVINPKQKLVA